MTDCHMHSRKGGYVGNRCDYGVVGNVWVKGWQPVGKMLFLFHRLSMFYPCVFNDGMPVVHISTLGKRQTKRQEEV